MTDQACYSAETIDSTLVVQFTQSSLVFHDQLRPIEVDLKSPADQTQCQSVVFDFRGVDYISSSVWGEIIHLNRLLRESGRQLRLCNLTDKLQEVFATLFKTDEDRVRKDKLENFEQPTADEPTA